jgi:hypothetical protein
MKNLTVVFWIACLLGCLSQAWGADDRLSPAPADRQDAAFQKVFENYFEQDAVRAMRLGLFSVPKARETVSFSFLGQADSRLKVFLGEVPFQQRMAIYGFLSGLIGLGVVAGIFYMLGLRLRSRREELVMRYQQEMLKMVRDLAVSPGFGLQENRQAGKAFSLGMPGVIEPILPALNHPGALPPETQDPVFQLTRLIFTGNLKERALAAARLLKLDETRGLNIIRELIAAPDPFQRESMAIALGESYHAQTVELLSTALSDGERRVSVAAFRALSRLSRLPDGEIPAEARPLIKGFLQQAPVYLKNSRK